MGARIRRKRRGAPAGVPMAPMIDMVFLLLVFFMTASAMSQAGSKVELNLPESPSSVVPKDLSGRATVSLDREGQLYWGAEPIKLEALRKRLRAEKVATPALKLRIRADRTTPFSAVKDAMRAAAAEGVDSYLYAAYQGEGGA